jgi:hypothetical protein
MARLAVLFALIVVLAACSGSEAPPPPRQTVLEFAVYPFARRGFVGQGTSLRPIDPETLQPLARRGLRLGGWAEGHLLSPDGRTLTFGLAFGELVFVDMPRPTLRARMVLGSPNVFVYPVGWPREDLLIGVACDYAGKYGCLGHRILLIDAERYRVRARIHFGSGSAGAGAQAAWAYDARAGRAVFLASSDQEGHAARMIVVDRDASVREVELQRITAGARLFGNDRPPWLRYAALTLDRGRAIVVSPYEPVAEVDLRTLAVRYHAVAGLDTPLASLRRARLEPWAGTLNPHEKSYRTVERLGDGLLRVSGVEQRLAGNGRLVGRVALVPRILDTRTWSARLSRPHERGEIAAGMFLVSRQRVDEERKAFVGPYRLDAYDRAGRLRYSVRMPRYLTWRVFETRLYVGLMNGRMTRVYDLRTGRFLHHIRPRDVGGMLRWRSPERGSRRGV